MGDINLKTALGGQINITPTNTASNYTLTVPASNGTMLTTAGGTLTGDITFTTPSTTTASYINWTNGTGTVASIGGYSDSTTTGHLEFYTTTGSALTEVMRIDNAGNVGIGTASPGSYGKMAVYASSGYVNYAIESGASDYRFYANASDGGLQSVTSGNPIVFSTNSGAGATERMRIASSGNVGIGNSNPPYPLTVTTNINGDSVILHQNTSTGASSQSLLQLLTGTNRLVNLVVNYTGQYFYVGGANITTKYSDFDTHYFRNNSGVLRSYIDSAGNFGFNSGYGSAATAYGCRAWVMFNGSTAGIYSSGNVSSITKNSTGNYTVNLAVALVDTNYAAVVSACPTTGSQNSNSLVYSNGGGGANGPTTSSFRVLTGTGGWGAYGDCVYTTVAVFR